jgi:hypothetical protein
MDETLTKRAFEWLMFSGDTGLSSEAMCAYMVSGVGNSAARYPHDASDLGRCLRLLDRFPEWKHRVWEMGDLNDEWNVLTRNWGELEALYRREKYEECSARMFDLLKPLYEAQNERSHKVMVRDRVNAKRGASR